MKENASNKFFVEKYEIKTIAFFLTKNTLKITK